MAKWRPVSRRLFRLRQKNERDLWRVDQLLQGNDPDGELLRAEVAGLAAVVRARVARLRRKDGGGR